MERLWCFDFWFSEQMKKVLQAFQKTMQKVVISVMQKLPEKSLNLISAYSHFYCTKRLLSHIQ